MPLSPPSTDRNDSRGLLVDRHAAVPIVRAHLLDLNAGSAGRNLDEISIPRPRYAKRRRLMEAHALYHLLRRRCRLVSRGSRQTMDFSLARRR